MGFLIRWGAWGILLLLSIFLLTNSNIDCKLLYRENILAGNHMLTIWQQNLSDFLCDLKSDILCVTLQNVSNNFKSPIGYKLCCLSCKKQMLRWCGIFAHFCARLKLTVICRIKDAKTTQPEIWFASSFFSIFNSNTISREKGHNSL